MRATDRPSPTRERSIRIERRREPRLLVPRRSKSGGERWLPRGRPATPPPFCRSTLSEVQNYSTDGARSGKAFPARRLQSLDRRKIGEQLFPSSRRAKGWSCPRSESVRFPSPATGMLPLRSTRSGPSVHSPIHRRATPANAIHTRIQRNATVAVPPKAAIGRGGGRNAGRREPIADGAKKKPCVLSFHFLTRAQRYKV